MACNFTRFLGMASGNNRALWTLPIYGEMTSSAPLDWPGLAPIDIKFMPTDGLRAADENTATDGMAGPSPAMPW
jgi:hypothetical protein